jgi:hypothetical protein
LNSDHFITKPPRHYATENPLLNSGETRETFSKKPRNGASRCGFYSDPSSFFTVATPSSLGVERDNGGWIGKRSPPISLGGLQNRARTLVCAIIVELPERPPLMSRAPVNTFARRMAGVKP